MLLVLAIAFAVFMVLSQGLKTFSEILGTVLPILGGAILIGLVFILVVYLQTRRKSG